MADKNGFLLYKDLIHTVQKLPKDKAGELFLHILSYVNDENPVTDDLIIQLAFEPVKQKLKRDLKKYEQTTEKNRENANKRWQKNNVTASEPLPNDATASENIPKHAIAFQRMPNDTKHADIDTDTVNGTDTGSDTDILLKKETKEIVPISEELFCNEIKTTQERVSKKVAQKKVLNNRENLTLIIPEDFICLWEEWNQYRKDRKIKAYAGVKWEQKAVDNLIELSNKDPIIAKMILEQSYRNSYQGFFPLKNNKKPLNNNGEFETNR